LFFLAFPAVFSAFERGDPESDRQIVKTRGLLYSLVPGLFPRKRQDPAALPAECWNLINDYWTGSLYVTR
jgi:hypothetical protein